MDPTIHAYNARHKALCAQTGREAACGKAVIDWPGAVSSPAAQKQTLGLGVQKRWLQSLADRHRVVHDELVHSENSGLPISACPLGRTINPRKEYAPTANQTFGDDACNAACSLHHGSQTGFRRKMTNGQMGSCAFSSLGTRLSSSWPIPTVGSLWAGQ